MTVQVVAGHTGTEERFVTDPFTFHLDGNQKKEFWTDVTIPNGTGQPFVHAYVTLPDGRGSGETDTGRVAKEKKEYSEGDIERLDRAAGKAGVAIAYALRDDGGDARIRSMFKDPASTIAAIDRTREAYATIIDVIHTVQAPIERNRLEVAVAKAVGREKPKTLVAQKEEMEEGLRVKKVGLEEGEKDVGNLVVQTMLDAEGLLPWYQKLPEAGRKAFLAVWRGGKYANGEGTEGEREVGKFIFDHANRDISLAFAKTYAEHPAEVGVFAGVARQTYVVSGGEYASNGELMPAGPGGGNFTWEGMFGWMEENDLFGESNDNTNMPLDRIYNGLVFVFEAYTEESSKAQSQKQFIALSPHELTGEFRVEIQTHPVADLPGFSEPHHLSLRIVPVDIQTHNEDPRFIAQSNGTPAFTIGAGSSDVKLTARFNRKSDVDTTNGKQFTFLQMPAHFLNSADWVTALVNATIRYKNDKKYEIFSNRENNRFTTPGYNSNSFIAGLLNATDTELPDVDNIFTDSYYPGWENPLPIDSSNME